METLIEFLNNIRDTVNALAPDLAVLLSLVYLLEWLSRRKSIKLQRKTIDCVKTESSYLVETGRMMGELVSKGIKGKELADFLRERSQGSDELNRKQEMALGAEAAYNGHTGIDLVYHYNDINASRGLIDQYAENLVDEEFYKS